MDKYDGNTFSDENIYASALNLFLSLSWRLERSERITYMGEGRWDVDSSVSINFAGLIDVLGGGDFWPEFEPILKDSVLSLPVFELPKYSYMHSLEARRSNGDRASIAPDELSYAFEWMIILGCVVRAVRSGYLDVSDGSSWRPSLHLTQLIFKEIRNPASPQFESRSEYVKEFREMLKKRAGATLENEYDRFARNCPGFELLFVHFAYNQICLLQVDKDSAVIEGEVFSLKFTEYHDQYADYKRKNRRGKSVQVLKTLFRKHRFTYPLRRVGTSDTEKITIYAPGWTVFQPLIPRSIFKYRRAKLYWEIKEECDRDEPSSPLGSFEKRFGSNVILSEDRVSLRTFLAWDDRLEQTHRRFEVFEKVSPIKAKELSKKLGRTVEPDETPEEGWGTHSLNNEHSYIFRVGWRARTGRRVRANLAFLFISFLSVCFVNAYIHDWLGFIGINYGDQQTLFGTLPNILSAVVELSALVYSNSQEQVPYYRYTLMRLPKYLVRVVAVCDVLAFVCGLLFGHFGSSVTPVMIASNMAIAVALVLLLIWLVYNGDRHGLNRFEFGSEPTTFPFRNVQDATRGT